MCNWRDTGQDGRAEGLGAWGGDGHGLPVPLGCRDGRPSTGADWRPGGGWQRKAVTTRGAEVFRSLLSVPPIPFLVPRVGPAFSAGTLREVGFMGTQLSP